ncbi:filament-like plant protein 7 isoform X2 [Andrographis paniculata]|uniref:filament-like plant protein 7 isoform X2 n=1 Tax=Andrographis paniculata TaxID=175694 RepID=UPI0021E832FB|nr:filament-like plant protein 7 isoform X2 [Andrographis paniculata]
MMPSKKMDEKPCLWNKKVTEKTLAADQGNGTEEFMTLKGDLERNLAKKQEKIAQEAIAGGDLCWEKAKIEAVSSKKDLVHVQQQRAASEEERSARLEAALNDCTQQLHFVREDQEKRIQTAVVKALEELDKTRLALEQRLAEAGKRIVKLDSDNTQLKKAVSGKDKVIQDLSEYRSQVEADFNALTVRIDSTEKENSSLKYEVRVLEKELDIRNEEADFNRRAADVAQKKYKDSLQKVASLESECQKLRSLVQKRLPGPAALTRMKNEVEILGRDHIGSIRKKTTSLCGSPDFSADAPSKGIGFLTEQLQAVEEENRTLRHALTKRSTELQASRSMYVRAASRFSRGDESVKSFLQDRSVTTLSDAGSEDKASCAESWASALISELDNFKNEKQLGSSPSHGNMGGSEMYLMDDFAEMEKFAVDLVGSSHDSSEEGNPVIGLSSETTGKSQNSAAYDARNNGDISSMSINKVVKILEGLSKCVAESLSDKDDGGEVLSCKNLEAGLEGYFVRVVRWKADELSDILQQSVRTCNELLNGEAEVPQFAELVAYILDWAVNHCFSLQDFLSMDKKSSIKTDVDNADLSRHTEREEMSCTMKEATRLSVAPPSNMEPPVTDSNGLLRPGDGWNEFESLKDITEKLESVRQCEFEADQIENQTSAKDDLLLSVPCSNNQNIHTSMTITKALGDGQTSEDPLQNDQEINAASRKLAECQETILNLEKQFKALASPNGFKKDALISIANPTTPRRSSSSQRLSLLDNMLAEDNKQTSLECSRKFTKDPKEVDSDVGSTAPSGAIVPVKKNGGKGFLKKLFRWHKKGKSKKTLPFS